MYVASVLILGDNELASGNIIIKNMQSGEQEKIPLNKVEEKLQTLKISL